MNGLALISTVLTQVVVASRKAIARSGPSGSQTQASMAQTAMVSSVAIPAAATFRRWSRRVSFHTSLVSV